MFNNMKKYHTKLIACIIILGMSLMSVPVADAATLLDLESSSDYAKDAIIELVEKDIITGDEHGNFNPQKTVTRAEMITLIVKALAVDTTNIPDTQTFTDVPKTHWAYKYVEAAYREGIVKGISEEVFGKDAQCTREQMTVMFVRSLELTDEIFNTNEEFTYINELSDKDMISSWAKNSVEFSLASGLMKGTGNTTFSPKGNAQRQQVAVVTYRLINEKENILEFAKDTPEIIKYPELHEALLISEEYKGEFDLNTLMNIHGTTPEETMTISATGNGATNGTDSQLKLTMLISTPEMTLPELTFETIQVDNKVYVKEPDMDMWVEVSPEEMGGTTPIESTPDDFKQINEDFLSIYNELPIEKTGTVELDGVNATKYTLYLDYKAIKDLFPEEFLVQTVEMDELFDNDQLNLEIEFYLGEENQIIKQVLTLNGNFELEEEKLTYNMSMDINYKNIGSDIEITAPAIDSIEVTQEDTEIVGE